MMNQTVYLYRKYRKQTGSGCLSYAHVTDSLKHASIIKNIFLSHHPDCWEKGYGPHVTNNIRHYILKCNLPADQLNAANAELEKICSSN